MSRACADDSNDVERCLKSLWLCGGGGGRVIIVSALSISLRDKERLRDR